LTLYYLPLKVKIEQFFDSSLSTCQLLPELAGFCQHLQLAQQQLEAPMRVAIVGIAKAGKSTFMNAILGEYVVFTDTEEATFNVSKFTYAAQKSLLIHYKEPGRQPEAKPFEDLKQLTVRDKERWDYLSSIKYVEIFYPNPILKLFSLIDTPGLESAFGTDSDNTQEFMSTNQQYLSIYGAELAMATQLEAQQADAVIYLFDRSLAQVDQDFLQKFSGEDLATISPLNAIGGLTQIDKLFLDIDKNESLMATAQEVVKELPSIAQSLFYQIQPISGFLAWGAQSITDREWDILAELAKIPQPKMNDLLFSYDSFIKPDKKVDISIEDRKIIRDRLNLYGISLVYKSLNQGVTDRSKIVNLLLKESGVDDLIAVIKSHFGNRAHIVKLNAVFNQLQDHAEKSRRELYGEPERALAQILRSLQKIASQENSFKELQVLHDYYDHKLDDFSIAEAQELLCITGEHGNSCCAKLALTPAATTAEMLLKATAGMNKWRSKSQQSSGKNRIYLSAANVMHDSYQEIFMRLSQVQQLLDG
jgi:GTPase SAR1 family protein